VSQWGLGIVKLGDLMTFGQGTEWEAAAVVRQLGVVAKQLEEVVKQFEEVVKQLEEVVKQVGVVAKQLEAVVKQLEEVVQRLEAVVKQLHVVAKQADEVVEQLRMRHSPAVVTQLGTVAKLLGKQVPRQLPAGLLLQVHLPQQMLEASCWWVQW